MKALKIISIVLVACVCAVCVGLDAWYVYIYFQAPEKNISQTFNVGLQTLEDGTQKPIAEVKLFKNSNSNGLTAFEFKWNNILDESRQNFYSQGVQFIGNIFFEYCTDTSSYYYYKDKGWFGFQDHYYKYGGRFVPLGSKYEYQKIDTSEFVSGSTDPIDDRSFFKLTLNVDGEDKIFGMKFKGFRDGSNNEDDFAKLYQNGEVDAYHLGVDTKSDDFVKAGIHTDYYLYYDFNYFLKLIYEAIQSIPVGVNSPYVFQFGYFFDYFEYDENTHQYSKTSVDAKNADKISSLIKSFYCINVQVVEDGLKKASDSLFNCVQGNSNFNIAGDYSSDDYFVGRSVHTAYIHDFDFVQVSENNYCLKLKNSFIDYYSQFNIYLDVVIDLDELKKSNINFVGFTEDSGLNNFTIHKCVSRQMQDGRVVESEVPYV